MGVPAQLTFLWQRWPSRMHIYGSVGPQLERCKIELFSPYGGTHNKAPKRKDIALLAL